MLPGAAERCLQPLRGAEPSRLSRVTSLFPARLPARSRRPGAGLLPGHLSEEPPPALPPSGRAGTGTRGAPGAGTAPTPRSLPPCWRSPCRGRTPGEGTVPSALPAPSPALPPPLVTGTDELIMMWLLLMHLCGAGCASGG